MRKPVIARTVANQRGATLVFVAITLTVLLSAMALAIDMGMLLTARAEAQRAADAAALAGAQEFMKNRPNDAVKPARQQAYAFAEMNTIQKVPIDSGEVTVQVFPNPTPQFPTGRVVRVTIRREAVPTWFARIFGVNFVPIAAVAAAEASPAGTVKCLKPFAIPDLWDDRNGDSTYDAGDVYQPHNGDFGSCPGGALDGTGYGSCSRGPERDFGTEVTIKVADPSATLVRSFSFPIELERDPDMPDCAGITGGSDKTGAKAYEQNICSCNTHPYKVGDRLDVENGNGIVGPTATGVDALMRQDPYTSWDGHQLVSTDPRYMADPMSSPRVMKIALFAPNQITGPSDNSFVVSNFALFFLEGQYCVEGDKFYGKVGQEEHCPVRGRFLYFAQGDQASDTTTGTLVKVLRLIE